MKKSQLVTLGVVALFIVAIIGVNTLQPSRITEQRMEEQAEAQRQLEEANKTPSLKEQFEAKLDEAVSSDPNASNPAMIAAATPADAFQVEFQCSNGTFIVEVYPEWAPIGAEQFRQIIEAGIYNEARFFRVIPGFVVQWGIPGDPELAAEWDQKTMQDEAVKTSNVRGTITYAKSQAPNSRSSQVFINFRDNTQLDGMGFSPFGKVVKGMDVVEAINAQYREEPDQGEIQSKGNAYLKEYFPKLDYIKEAKILGTVAAPAAAAPDVAQDAASATPELAAQN